MSVAPRDGSLIRLWLHGGGDFVGCYSDRLWGWVALHEIDCPLIRGDVRFAGWAPIEPGELRQIQREWLIRPEQRAPRTVVVVPAVSPKDAPAMASRIVKAKRPGR